MEKVDGVPLLDWIDQSAPDEDQRLALLLQICDAVAYAHRNLIVHRDLTPANILVAEGNQAKLIDFGIARPDGEEAASSHAHGLPLRALTLTPGFAAPERLVGEPATTLSDIYSAGRMMARLIDKPRKSEIQAIIDKAIARNPEERYLTMDQLAEDVRRYRERRPVRAMPFSTAYWLRKWVLRNRPLAALAALLVFAVAIGTGATAWYWQRAESAREQADQRFSEVRTIAKFMLFDLYDELEAIPGNTKALANIATVARVYLERLAASENLSPELRLEIAQGYHRLSTVSGNPEGSNLGLREDARNFLDKAIDELRALHELEASDVAITEAFAEAHYSDAILRFIAEEDNEGAIVAAQSAAELFHGLMQADPDNEDYRLAWYRSRLQAAKPLVWIDRGEEGAQALDALREEIASYLADHPGDDAARQLLASTNSQLGSTLSWHFAIENPQYQGALPPLDRAIEIYDGLIAEAEGAARDELQQTIIAALFERSLVLSDLQRYDGALADLARAEQLVDPLIRRDPDDQGALRRREALHSQKIYVLMDLGRTQEAAVLASTLMNVRLRRSQAYPDNGGFARDAASAQSIYAEALGETGQIASSCRAYREAQAAWTAIGERMPLSSIDRENNVEPIDAAVRKCDGSS